MLRVAPLKAHPLALTQVAFFQVGVKAPSEADSALFGAWAPSMLGPLALGLLGLIPTGLFLLLPAKSPSHTEPAEIPTAAPAHVLALLGAGLSENPVGLRPTPPYLSLSALALGGL